VIAIEQAHSLQVFTLEPSRGRVRIERAGSPSIDWAVPTPLTLTTESPDGPARR
jgi:hypothetical protein